MAQQLEEIDAWLNGKHSHVFHQVVQRFAYLRQYAPALLQHLHFEREVGGGSLSDVAVTDAIDLLRDLNRENKRKLPEEAPLAFVPKSLHALVQKAGEVNKQAWECALLTAVRDEIRAGNIFVEQSKRFGRFDDFFIADTRWRSLREAFFQRAGLPANAADVPAYLSGRLNLAYDLFLDQLPNNAFASVDERGWRLSVDQADKLEATEERKLEELRAWLAKHLLVIKLPDLLIEVDNELQFTHHFMTAAQLEQREAENVCLLLATVMAYGCNIGPYTMARLTEDIDYEQIKQVTDWQLTEEAQRQALAQLVNATAAWTSPKCGEKVEPPAAMANDSR